MLKKIERITHKLSPNLQKIIGNTGWLLADRVLRMGTGLLVGVWVARYLGPKNFGIFNYAIAFTAIFNTVANLGLDNIVIRNIVRQPNSKDEILGTAFFLKVFAQATIIFVSIATIIILRPTETLTHQLVGIITVGMFFESYYVIDYWFQSQIQSKYTVWSKNIGLVLASSMRIVLIQIQAPLLMFAWAYAAETALSALGLVVAYRIKGYFIRAWHFSWKYAIELLKDSWTLILSSFVIMIYMRTDQLMLGQMIGDKAVGIYSAAVKISELWYFIPMAITNSAFPSIVKARQESQQSYYEQIQKVLDFLTILSLAVGVIVSLLSHQIVNLMYGQEYSDAGAILFIHIWTGIFVSLGLVSSLWTTAENLMPFAFITSANGAVINIVLNYFLIKSYGGLGAAMASLVAQCVASYFSYLFLPQTRIIFIQQTKALVLPSLFKRLLNYTRVFRKK
ncbi:flippase [Fischerella thermalis]|uniref:O-unit flippase n=1 Tax=Fischerella thermalis CCMEE 5318 TaxID=2019666 RepID=A0A2N6L3U4_9CYAN|nr:flippase [Fischerella thermalis]PMB15005.1 O-unit flippase [Fischerella thermalis CCMEE 5318]PMB37787.1 O-unit flippase [Fischerella thermalis CCMEE 5319]